MMFKRLFRKKVEGRALQNLVNALGGNYQGYFHREDGWSVSELTGRASIRPVRDGFDITLNLYGKETHTKYLPHGGKETTSQNFRGDVIKGVIPYSPKLKLEDRTRARG